MICVDWLSCDALLALSESRVGTNRKQRWILRLWARVQRGLIFHILVDILRDIYSSLCLFLLFLDFDTFWVLQGCQSLSLSSLPSEAKTNSQDIPEPETTVSHPSRLDLVELKHLQRMAWQWGQGEGPTRGELSNSHAPTTVCDSHLAALALKLALVITWRPICYASSSLRDRSFARERGLISISARREP